MNETTRKQIDANNAKLEAFWSQEPVPCEAPGCEDQADFELIRVDPCVTTMGIVAYLCEACSNELAARYAPGRVA